MKKTKNPVIYIGGPGYSREQFEPLIASIGEHLDEFLRTISITAPDGKPTTIELFVEASTHEATKAYAKRVSREKRIYEVRMTAGLSYNIWLASRAFATTYDFFPWLNQCKIMDASLRKSGRREIVADFAYYISSYYILLHEISHVILGHCDYVQDEMGLESLDEFSDELRPLTDEEVRTRRAFEAEADRQAGEFLVAFFENSLGDDGLGVHLRFPSRKCVYEFYAYAITSVFVLLQQLTQRKGLIHPKPNERQYILISSLAKYFQLHQKEQFNLVQRHAYMAMLQAGEKMGLIGSYNVADVMNNALALSWVDDVVNETGIRKYQHQLS